MARAVYYLKVIKKTLYDALLKFENMSDEEILTKKIYLKKKQNTTQSSHIIEF